MPSERKYGIDEPDMPVPPATAKRQMTWEEYEETRAAGGPMTEAIAVLRRMGEEREKERQAQP